MNDDSPAMKDLVAMLPLYLRASKRESEAKREKETLAKPIRAYLEANPGEVIWDGESQTEATLGERRLPSNDYDVLTLYSQEPELFKRLVLHGCVTFKADAIKAAGANVGGVERYAYPPGVTHVLNVRQKK